MQISKEEYFDLKRAELELNLLSAGGVVNWEWYGYSLNPEGEDDFSTKVEKLRKAIYERRG